MAVPVLDTPLEIEEERDYSHYFERENPSTWAAAAYEMRIALDTAGNYPKLTIPCTINDNILSFDLLKSQNNLDGGKKYYFDMVVIYDNGTTYTEFKGIINCIYSI